MKRQPYLAQSPEDFQRLTLGIYSARHGDTIHVRITVNLNQTNAPAITYLTPLAGGSHD
jgi:hypothetical protein